MKMCASCPHPKAAHGPEDGPCRFGGCPCGGFVDLAPPAGPNIPTLTIPPDPTGFTVGIPDMLFDGQPFPWATVGPWTLTFEHDGIALLTVSVPVGIGENVNHESAAEPEPVGA